MTSLASFLCVLSCGVVKPSQLRHVTPCAIHVRVRTHQQSRVESDPVQADSRVMGCSHRPSRVSKAMENLNMIVLHTIMWRWWCRKRRNMWVHPINIKRPEFRIRNILPLIPEYARGWKKFRGFFRMNIEQFYRLSIGGSGNMKTKHRL